MIGWSSMATPKLSTPGTSALVRMHSTPGNGARGGGVDAHDAGMRVRTAQHLHVQHVGHPHVGRVLDGAGDLGRRVEPPRAVSDETGGLVLAERGLGLAAVQDVPRQLHRIDDLLVAGAAADVAAQAFLDLVQVGGRVAAQRGRRRHHHARNAVAALARAALVEGALQHRHPVVAIEVVDRLDLGALDLLHRRQAALDQLAVDEHRAGAALAGAAAFLVAGELQLLAHEIDQPVVIGHVAADLAAVDGGRDPRRRVPAFGRRHGLSIEFRHVLPPWAVA